MRRLKQSVRDKALSFHNRRRLRGMIGETIAEDATVVFFVFTPDLVHFAPFCIPHNVANIQAIALLNGVSREDADWMRCLHPNIPVVPLSSSLTGNAKSMLPHATVINDLFAVLDRPFCIQDPDCFVTDNRFYDAVSLDAEQHFAAGPFTKMPTDHDHVLPDTFFILFNTQVFKRIERTYRVSADITRDLPAAAAHKIEAIGYSAGQHPEQFKGYFDTLQAFWLLSLAEGYSFKKLDGEGRTLFHIGGTSYLKNSDYELDHWDYWPLAVRYFNLRLIERDMSERFRDRFQHLIQLHGSADQVLRDYPQFLQSNRYRDITLILESFEIGEPAAT
jgi:hypothetical protein